MLKTVGCFGNHETLMDLKTFHIYFNENNLVLRGIDFRFFLNFFCSCGSVITVGYCKGGMTQCVVYYNENHVSYVMTPSRFQILRQSCLFKQIPVTGNTDYMTRICCDIKLKLFHTFPRIKDIHIINRSSKNLKKSLKIPKG